MARCESSRQQKSTAGKNPEVTARPAGAVGWPAVGQRRMGQHVFINADFLYQTVPRAKDNMMRKWDGSELRLPAWIDLRARAFLPTSMQALMLGPGGSHAVTVLPTAPEFRLSSPMHAGLVAAATPSATARGTMHLQVRRRLGPIGRSPSSLPHARKFARGAPLEWATACVCCEAGARVASNACGDMNRARHTSHRGAGQWPPALAGGAGRR